MKCIDNKLVLALLILFGSNSVYASPKEVLLSYVEYPPYYGESLPNGGPISEIITAAFKLKGYKVKRELLPWSRALEWTKEGRYDGIYTAWYRADRETDFAFSSKLPANEVVLFKRKDADITFNSYADLKPYTIGVVRGYANPPGFDDAKLKLAPVTSDKQNLLKLFASRIDLALVDKALGNHIINTHIPDAANSLDWINPPLKVDPQYLMFSRKAEGFQAKLDDFNKGLKALTESGELQKILSKHGL